MIFSLVFVEFVVLFFFFPIPKAVSCMFFSCVLERHDLRFNKLLSFQSLPLLSLFCNVIFNISIQYIYIYIFLFPLYTTEQKMYMFICVILRRVGLIYPMWSSLFFLRAFYWFFYIFVSSHDFFIYFIQYILLFSFFYDYYQRIIIILYRVFMGIIINLILNF